MEDEILLRIDEKLDAMVRLMASGCIEGKNKTDAIKTLGALGLDPDLIAEVVGTTSGTVRARLSEVRKKNRLESKKITKKAESK